MSVTKGKEPSYVTSATATPDRLLLRVREAAEILGLGRSTLFEVIAAGELPVVRIGRRGLRIRPTDLESWIDSHREFTERQAGTAP